MPAFDFVLAGRYRLVAPLGEGGMAAVYRGRDLRLNREVAVKVLHEDLTRDPTFLARFQREAQFVASLSHPHIVPVYDVGEEHGTHFIVMEYIRGRTLKDAIESQGRLPADRAVGVMRSVLDALGYAHRQGLIHRDVKPPNILVTADGTVRLADFGIAHVADGSTTRTAAILGSAHYLSPEQSRGQEATPQSDLYACGIVLYEMLSGRPPFQGPNALAIASMHLHDDPPPLGPNAPDVDARLEAVVMRALSKDPRERFEDAESFAAALDGLPAGEPTAFQPIARLPADGTPRERPAALAPAGSHPPGRDPVAHLVFRRSGRKSYILGAFLCLVIVAAAYLASLPIAQRYLPSYPSAPYAALPALCAAVVLITWLNARSWVYSLDGNAAVVQWGVLSHRRLGVALRHVATVELKQSPMDRLLGVGTVELLARDRHGAERRLILEDLPAPRQRYDEIMQLLGQALRLPEPDEPDEDE